MGCDVRIEEDAIDVRGPARLRGVDADFTQMGDVATTLMAIAPFADGPVTVPGHRADPLRGERPPVAAATELRRMGLRVEDDVGRRRPSTPARRSPPRSRPTTTTAWR